MNASVSSLFTFVVLFSLSAPACAENKQAAAPLTEADLARLWDDLGKADAVTGHKAVWALADAPALAIPFLRKRLRSKPNEASRVATLIRQLDDDAYTKRTQAQKELERLGNKIAPALRAVLAGKPSPEARRRLRKLLDRCEDRPLVLAPGDELRTARAIHVLELIGSVDACKVLQALKDGPPSDAAEDASAALERHERRRKKP
jgi:hypothetical protein